MARQVLLLSLVLSPAAAMAGPWPWDVHETPPELVNPTVIDLSSHPTIVQSAYSLHCSGLLRRVTLGPDEDALIEMSGSDPLTAPLHVTGGRNVRIVGLHIELAVQPGCGVGQLANQPVAQHPNANIHPRTPGGIAVRLQQSGHTFVEGAYIDVKGHEADCFVLRNPNDMSTSEALQQRRMTIQNTRCVGVEGLGQSDIGDGVHGDLFQNQGRDVFDRLVLENVTMRTSQEGIVIHGDGAGSRSNELILRRYDYSWDARFTGDDSYEGFGLAFAGSIGSFSFDGVLIDDYRDGGDYGILNNQRYGESPASNVQPHPGIMSGLPGGGSYAPAAHTGVGYVSPHDGAAPLPPAPQPVVPSTPGNTIDVVATSGTPDWGAITPFALSDNDVVDPDTAEVRFAWTEDALLARVEVTDTNITIDESLAIWRNDSVELLLDPHFDRATPIQPDDAQLQVRADDGAVRRNAGDGQGSVTNVPLGAIEATATASPTGYVVEARVPWSELGVQPAGGSSIGFLVGINDREPDGKTHYSFDGVDRFLYPELWGELRLQAAAGVPPEPPLASAPALDNPRAYAAMNTQLLLLPDATGFEDSSAAGEPYAVASGCRSAGAPTTMAWLAVLLVCLRRRH